MRYRLRTLLILMAVMPPLIGFWPDIKQRAIARVTQINSSDVAVVAAASTLIALRIRFHSSASVLKASPSDTQPNVQS